MCLFYFDPLQSEDTDHLQFTGDELNETLPPPFLSLTYLESAHPEELSQEKLDVF